MSDCNGIKLKGLNQDCNRIAVKSTHASSWNPTYKTRMLARAKEYDVAIHRNELLVISFQDGSGHAEIEVTPLGSQIGTLLMQSSRNAHQVLRVGAKYRYKLAPGESITLRNDTIVHPTKQPQGVAAI